MSSHVSAAEDPVDAAEPPSDAALRVVYQAVRALVADDGVVTAGDLSTVTSPDADAGAAAMDSLARRGPIDVEPLDVAGEPTWAVTRTDRW